MLSYSQTNDKGGTGMGDMKDAITELNEYQVEASRTAIYPGQGSDTGFFYAVLGVANEGGEVAGVLKKQMRDGTPDFENAIIKELGDVLWYVAAVASELNVSLSEVATANISKLQSRADAGTLRGSGDDR